MVTHLQRCSRGRRPTTMRLCLASLAYAPGDAHTVAGRVGLTVDAARSALRRACERGLAEMDRLTLVYRRVNAQAPNPPASAAPEASDE